MSYISSFLILVTWLTQAILTRVNTYTNVTYKGDPTIFGWELMNEPRCLSDPSGDKLQAWIQEMAFHVKSIDPVHLLEIGAEGFYGPSTPERLQLNPNMDVGQLGTDFIRNHRALGIDFASVHMYPDSWLSNSSSDARLRFAKHWMQNHIDDAENVLKMPVLFGEFGASSKDEGFNLTFRDKFISTVCTIQLKSIRSGGSGGGCLLWQLFPEGMEYMDDGFAVVPSKSPSTSLILSRHSRRLQLFNSRCSWRCYWGCTKKNPHDEL